MKDFVLELAEKQRGLNAKLNIMREYLQAYILRILHDAGFFRTNAFLGGTALRFLYDLPRFSEDLDFSLAKKPEYQFVDIIKKIKQELVLSGYDISVSYNDEKIVQHAFIKFRGLMFDAKISSHPEQNFSVKIEVDTNPPQGAILETNVTNKYFPLSLCRELSRKTIRYGYLYQRKHNEANVKNIINNDYMRKHYML